MNITEFGSKDLLGLGLEERLGVISGLEVLPHDDTVSDDLDVPDVVLGSHGVLGLLSDLDMHSAVAPADVGDMLLGGSVLGLGCKKGHLLSAAGKLADSVELNLYDLSTLTALVRIQCHESRIVIFYFYRLSFAL